MSTEHVSAELEGQPCNAYFFARWSTYAHPVTPHEPMVLEQALLRKQFYRAWSCPVSGQPRFELFEAVANNLQRLGGGAPPSEPGTEAQFFALQDGGTLGQPITAAQALKSGDFGLRFKRGVEGAYVVRQKIIYSYRYRYKANGSLDTVSITNAEGKLSVLQY